MNGKFTLQTLSRPGSGTTARMVTTASGFHYEGKVPAIGNDFMVSVTDRTGHSVHAAFLNGFSLERWTHDVLC